jgi:ABC-type transporter Mla subunit MlaD
VLSLITPENLPGVLTGIGGIFAAIGGATLWRVYREPPKPGTPDAAAVALADNTKATLAMVAALNAQTSQFAHNNDLFKQVIALLTAILKDMDDTKHDTAECKAHLAAIRDTLNRQGR